MEYFDRWLEAMGWHEEFMACEWPAVEMFIRWYGEDCDGERQTGVLGL